MRALIYVAALLLPQFVISGPLSHTPANSIVIVNEEPRVFKRNAEVPQSPDLKSMHVTSNIRNRYAKTEIETKYLNPKEQSQEATFTIILPDEAFISGFVMDIDGKKYEAYVREKEQAKKEYQQAVERGQSAGHVAMSARDSKKFTVSVNIEPQCKVIFTLTYEQLLKRKHGNYEMVINLHPGQLVDDFNIDVNINETRKIVDVNIPALRSGNEIIEATEISKNEFASVTNVNEDQTEVNVHFSPSIEQQKAMMTGQKGSDGSKGISGQFVVEYDVERDPKGGEVIVNDGYFVHFFAPSELEPIPKHVVFVLDVSGSMMGTKMKQLRDAMKVILSELNPEDYFHLVKFSTGVQVWNETWQNIHQTSESELSEPYIANAENIQKVQEVVGKMNDEGMTNIYDSLIVALRLTSHGIKNNDNEIQNHQPIIIFLTDGQANQGISNYDEILKMVDSKNDINKAAIFALSFGDDANKEFLKKLANRHSGFMRTIYEAADASLQLQYFYREISSPLLTDVNFVYADQVTNVTKNKFDILFKGSELVVAGKLTDLSDKFVNDVEAKTFKETRRFKPRYIPVKQPSKDEPEKKYGSLERLWAYMTIKQLLENEYENDKKQNLTKDEALALALKYSFVTPVSSLVVVKPNATESSQLQSAIEDRDNTESTRLYSARPGLRTSLVGIRKIKGGNNRAGIYVSTTSYMRPHSGMPVYDTSIMRPMSLPSPIFSISPLPRILPIDLPWLTSLLTNSNELTIDNKKYLIGNNATTIEDKNCQIQNLNMPGKCTLLSACPKVYPELDSLDSYRKYFCTLNNEQYAGVCCVGN